MPRIQKVLKLVSARQGQHMFQEIIDFKKHKISYRFKSRIRSNSNEFIDGIPYYSSSSHQNRRNSTVRKNATDDSSPQIIDEEDSEEEA